MRRTTQKEKKLEKLRKQCASSNPPKSKFKPIPTNEIINIPKKKRLDVLGTRAKTKIEDHRIYLSTDDYGRFSNAIARDNIIEEMACRAKLELVAYLSDALKINTSIKVLQLNTAFNDNFSEVIEYIAVIIQNSNLKSLKLDMDCLSYETDASLVAVVQALQNNTKLTSLTIPALNYMPNHFRALIGAFNKHPKLANLTVFPTLNGQFEMELIGDIIKMNRIRRLDLTRRTRWHIESLTPILLALKRSTSITDLSLEVTNDSSSEITAKEINILADALRTNQTLVKLNIKGNHLNADLLSIVFNSLQHHKTLTMLHFWNSSIKFTIQPAVSEFLNVNQSLTELDLSHVKMYPNQILSALKTNNALTALNLSFNALTLESSIILSEALKCNQGLIRLNISHCNFSDVGCQFLGDALKTNTCLLYLDIAGKDITRAGYYNLIQGLRQNDTLTDLSLAKAPTVPQHMHNEIMEIISKNKIYRRDVIVNTIMVLIQMARSADVLGIFPLEIWLQIFSQIKCSNISSFQHISEAILMHLDVSDITRLCSMRLKRKRGKTYFLQNDEDE